MNLSIFNFSEGEEAAIVRKQFGEANAIFQHDAIKDDEPVMCQLHDAFETYDTSHHNCLGCNFADTTWVIINFLQTYSLQNKIQYAYTTFIMIAYLLVERIDTLFDIIDLNGAYRAEHFKVLLETRRWANFLKHPKAFLLTHHPEFSYHGSPKNKELKEHACVIIDRTFVDKYYVSNGQDKALFKELENKDDVLVIFPDVVKLSKELCKAMHDCVEVVRNNSVFRWVLEDKTTFHDYWIDTPST